MKRHAGFTVIELLVTIVILFTASALFLSQKNRLEASALDDRRKVDINTLHHNLEKVYYATHKAYPRELNENTLPAVHPDTFKDPSGILINQQKVSPLGIKTGESDYRYEAKGCDQQTGKCTSYILHTNLSLEADYTKHSTHGNQSHKK
ncbi:MAG: type II secretion system protein [Candidatus Saccharibacteria bacterium]|nr:type II secretion system protein [Candidatus Saccharibacteria bacterium]